MLDERAELILESIVRLYIEQAEPIGSRALAKTADLDLSAATIRNVMSDLTEMGLIHQPHTSAGRIPTDKGYRYFVDHLAQDGKSNVNFTDLDIDPSSKAKRLEDLLLEITEELTATTHCTGVVLPPQSSASRFKQADLIPISATQVLVVLVTQTGMVKNKILKLRECPDHRSLHQISQIMTELFTNKTLFQIRAHLLTSLAEEEHGLNAQAIRLGKKAFDLEEESEGLLITGESLFCDYPEFAGKSELGEIYRILEDKRALSKVINRITTAHSGVQVAIGEETHTHGLEHCSLIATGYGNQESQLGSIGIIGPTRIDYPRVMAALDYSSKKLNHVISHFLDAD